MKTETKKRFLIGIDPGVNTGIAVWYRKESMYMSVQCKSIIEAIAYVLSLKSTYPNEIELWFEDARLRKWFGKADIEKLQGVGSIKRDCAIWEEFCKFHNIPYRAVAPKNIKTKLDAEQFKKITGWRHQTNSHARDAAMMVLGG